MKHWRLAALALLCPAIALAQSESGRSRAAGALKLGIDDVLLEAGYFNDAVEAKHAWTLRASPYLLWQPDRAWEVRLGARIDSQSQRGGALDADRTRARTRGRGCITQGT